MNDLVRGKKKIGTITETLANGAEQTIPAFTDGTVLFETGIAEPFKTYYRLSDEIRFGKDIQAKLTACEESYKILGDFVRAHLKDSAKLPDTIACRDVGVELYQRLGQWDKARTAINKIAAAGAYSDDRQDALNYLERYRQAAESAIKFLRANPGFQQNKIYDALSDVDRDCLKSFVRSSCLISKVKAGSMNKLFVK